VKTGASGNIKPAEAAVDRGQRELAAVARKDLLHLPPSCQWRFDVVRVYFEATPNQPRFELFQNIYRMA
jgi:hypothetical protein